MPIKEYKMLEDRTLKELMDDLNNHADEGWTVILSVQEYGYTKVLLERVKEQ